ncbi:hypothetical protein D3C75_1065940 [compost metagenome]
MQERLYALHELVHVHMLIRQRQEWLREVEPCQINHDVIAVVRSPAYPLYVTQHFRGETSLTVIQRDWENITHVFPFYGADQTDVGQFGCTFSWVCR